MGSTRTVQRAAPSTGPSVDENLPHSYISGSGNGIKGKVKGKRDVPPEARGSSEFLCDSHREHRAAQPDPPPVI